MTNTKKITYSAMFLALGLVLPFLTAQIQAIGSMLLPMHLPVLLCSFICGPVYGAIIGFICPLLRHLLFTMPPMPGAISMAFELCAYGFFAGFLYKTFFKEKSLVGIYVSLICAMLLGRVVWGVVQSLILSVNGSSLTFAAFIASAFTNAIPGIILQLIVVPIIVRLYEKSH